MNRSTILRRLRGLIGNAVVWGAVWCVATFAVGATMAVLGRPVSWDGVWRLAARLSVVGGLTGAAFSTFIGLVYRGRHLADIHWLRFGINGGVLAGLFVPTFMFVARTLAGDGPLAIKNYVYSGTLAAVFGGVAAGVSMLMAQRAQAGLSNSDAGEPDQLNAPNPFESASVQDRQKHKVPVQRSDTE